MLFCVWLFLCVPVLSAASKSAPRIEISPRNQTVGAGGPAFLFCSAAGNPTPQIEWRRNSRSMYSVRYKKYDLPNGSVLRIEPVRERRDDATFECRAENGVGEPATASATLTVILGESRSHGFPQHVPQPTFRVTGRGHTALMPCKVYGYPQPTITWLKNKLPLNMSVIRYSMVNDSLKITDVEDDDEGSYECASENVFGSAMSHPILLYVREKRVAPQFTISPDPLYEVQAGSNLNITCAAVGDPMPLVEWYIGCIDITPQGNIPIGRNILMLENVTVPDNYTCVATSHVGTVETSTALVAKYENQSSGAFPRISFFSDCECEAVHPSLYANIKCPPIYQAGCACPDRFDCPDENSTAEDVLTAPAHECVYEGKTYRLGEGIKTVDYCDNCSCNAIPEGAEVECTEVKCPELQLPIDRECYKVYEGDKCCAVDAMCVPTEPELNVHLIPEFPQLTAEVSWSESSLEYEHLKNYRLRYGRINASQMKEIIVEAGFLKQIISGLDHGANYSFYLSAWNKLRWSPEAVAYLSTPKKDVSSESPHTVLSADLPPSLKCSRCDVRYMEHYEAKNCFPVYTENCSCPVRFDCPNIQITPGNVCVRKKKVYGIGEAIPTENLCERCSCRGRLLGGAEISCLPLECPSNFRPPLRDGCYEVYEKDKCCSVDIQCVDSKNQSEELRAEGIPEFFAVAGGKAAMTCDISVPGENDNVTMIFWFKHDGSGFSLYTVDSRKAPLETADHIIVRLGSRAFFNVTSESPTLFIDPVELNDDGFYTCRTDFFMAATRTDIIRLHVEPSCMYEGKIYHLGERIYPKIDPCLSCVCSENWTEGNFDDCQIHECLLERKLRYLRKGCVPIYHEDKCCPTDFYCGTGFLATSKNNSFPKSPGACVLNGKLYFVGEVLDVKHPANCVTCTCEIPPDFTCVHQACLGPPQADFQNCRAIYQERECCPTYDCLQPPACDPVKCRNGCDEVTGRDGCPVCLCDKLLCTTPKCPDFCEVEYNVPVGSCPRCRCASIILQLAPVKCSPVQCDAQCFEVIGSDGCLTCICGPLCPTPKCDAGCSLQREVPQGQCRGCVCPSSPNRDIVNGILYGQEIQCAPVICGPTCRETVGRFGCPTCICDPCPLLKCSSNCEIKSIPLFGPCSKCVCNANQVQ